MVRFTRLSACVSHGSTLVFKTMVGADLAAKAAAEAGKSAKGMMGVVYDTRGLSVPARVSSFVVAPVVVVRSERGSGKRGVVRCGIRIESRNVTLEEVKAEQKIARQTSGTGKKQISKQLQTKKASAEKQRGRW